MRPALHIDRTLTLTVLAILIVGCFLVLQPFLTAIVWAAILCATIWPLFVRTRHWFGGRPAIAALVMVLLIALTVLAPFVIVGVTIADNAANVTDQVQELVREGPPEPPSWVAGLPLIGERAAATWGMFAHDTARLLDEARKYFEPARKVLVASGATVLGGILQLALSIFIAFFFFRDGDAIMARVRGREPHRRRARPHCSRFAAATTARRSPTASSGPRSRRAS